MSNLIRFEWLPESVLISPVGISFTGEVQYDQWHQLLATLSQLEVATQWAIGDAVNFGEWKYGEKYAQAIEATGFSYQALANYAWVARSVPIEARRQGLSWTHHRVVARLDPAEQKVMLERADNEGWTVEVLTEMVRGDSVDQPEEKTGNTVEVPAGISLTEAKNLLEAAVCNRKDGTRLCPLCPFKDER